ncbi:hypothetical protein [Aurantimonas coralicida]|uniref:hypothetical protein n=1 Tax=Aurantimonas coralicida TaxID=182270 RepID=UPI001D18C710|nr:hypothetical protein [Aurantimonas coralicida]MCC4298169.1 hypothetical protein [Aurantimonas coralicida]
MILMHMFARLIFVALLAAFAAGSVAHAAGSARMTADMVATDIAPMSMAGCETCGDPEVGDMGIACDFLCGSGSFAAILGPQADPLVRRISGFIETKIADDRRGLTALSAKQPPRTLI